MKSVKWMAAAAGVLCLASVAFGSGKELVFNLVVEPRTIDPVLNNAVDGSNVIYNVFEGLVRIGFDDAPEPGYAKSWDVSEDGLTWTFHLKDDMKWSDGKPMVAEEFRYGFLRALDSANASPYAFLGYCIKNGEAYFNGEAKAEDVGIEAPDDKTLVIKLEFQSPLLLDYLAYHVFYPARKDIIEKDPRGWSNSQIPQVGNGPFYVAEWKHNSEMILKKNPYYWDAENVKLDSLRFVMITDSNTALAAYKAGKVHYLNQVPPAMTPMLISSGEAKVAPTLGTSFSAFNLTKPPFDDVRVRKAFALAIDRKVLVEKVTQGGQEPATAFIPPVIPGASEDKDFRSEDPNQYLPVEADVAQARKLLAKAGYPDGKGFPKVSYKYNLNPANKSLAEAIQAMWKKNLGVEVELINQEWKVFIDTRLQKDFDIARHAYLVDFFDAASLLDLWVTDKHENIVGFSNKEYDDNMNASQSEMDRAKRAANLHRAEEILMAEMPVLPLYYYTTTYMMKDNVTGVYLSPRNWVFFRGADIK